jgi:Protein of unknown function (DUF4019)
MASRMSVKLGLAASIGLLSILSAFLPAAGQATPEQRAQRAAEAWLQLTDSGQYDASWETAARLFKAAIPKDQWARSMAGVRGTLGAVKARRLLGARPMKTLPGAPDGDYVVLQYEASFDNKQRAIETITPMLESDGQWRVSGYYVQ